MDSPIIFTYTPKVISMDSPIIFTKLKYICRYSLLETQKEIL
jgi:hypothetical protein